MPVRCERARGECPKQPKKRAQRPSPGGCRREALQVTVVGGTESVYFELRDC